MKGISTSTTDTFITSSGETVRYEDIFEGILKNIETYGTSGGSRLRGDTLKDIFQNAALRAVRSHGTYDESLSAPSTWGSRIAGNCETDTFRVELKRGALFSPLGENGIGAEDSVGGAAARLSGDEYEADRSIRSAEAERYILSAIASLNESYRDIITLRLLGLKVSGMARVLGCPPGVASTKLCRARKALRRALGKEFLGEFGYAV